MRGAIVGWTFDIGAAITNKLLVASEYNIIHSYTFFTLISTVVRRTLAANPDVFADFLRQIMDLGVADHLSNCAEHAVMHYHAG